MSGHVHDWTPDPEISGRSITRYRCQCGAVGWRHWPRQRGAHVPAIKVYAKGFDVEAYRAEVHRNDMDNEARWKRERAARRERGLEP